MGRDKASLVLAGRTLLQRTLEALDQLPGLEEIVLVIASRQELPPVHCDVPLTVVRDAHEALGPLPAIAAGLAVVRAPVSLILGCDTPFVRPALLRMLAERAHAHAIVMPLHEGRPQPLCSAIRRDALPAVEALLAAGERAPSLLAGDPRALRVEWTDWASADPEGVSFLGVNTPAELAQAETVAARLDAQERLGRA
ncbi:MAG: putative molybdenum cofactor guanylyltransferase [Chloroflexota bacterium]